LTSVSEVDALIALQDLQIREFEAKLIVDGLQADKSEFKSGSLDAEIAEVQALISGKESELTILVPGSKKHEDASIDLDGYKTRLRRLNYRKNDTASPRAMVEKNADLGEIKLRLLFTTRFKESLVDRKAAL
jgi:hypothetical protein